MGEDSGVLILEIVRRTEKSLSEHIEVEERRLARLEGKIDAHTSEISELKSGMAVTKARSGYVNAGIAMFVAMVVSWFGHVFGTRG